MLIIFLQNLVVESIFLISKVICHEGDLVCHMLKVSIYIINVQKFTYEIQVTCSELCPKVHVPVFYVYLDKSERQ